MAKKAKLPKTIAGIKVPKRLRKAGAVTAILNNPLGRSILADALVAAAGAAATAIARHRSSGGQVAQVGEAVADTGSHAASATTDAAKSAVGALGTAISEVAHYILAGDDMKKGKRKKRDKFGGYRADETRRTGGDSVTQRH